MSKEATADAQPIEPTSFVLEISEHNNTVLKYNDIDRDRFLKVSEDMIIKHMHNHIRLINSNSRNSPSIKNIRINIYNY